MVLRHITSLLAADGISARTMPVSLSEYGGRFSIRVGGFELPDTIPKSDWLPEPPPFFRQTRD